MVTLDSPLRDAASSAAKPLEKGLGLETVGDLLRHYPRRYAERGKLTNLRDLGPGEDVTVIARVSKVGRRQMRARRGSIVEAEITDGQGTLTLTFFNQPWREKELAVGRLGSSPARSPSSTASGSSTAPTSGSSTPRSPPATSRSSPVR